jgi:hypothetical protein
MKNQFYTYLHCLPNGNPFYVGKGIRNRAYQFDTGRNNHHKNIVAKYGRANIKVYIFECDTEAQAFEDEIQQISQFRNEGYRLCNIGSGGEGACTGRKMSAETRDKISTSLRGHKVSKETRDKISSSLVGNTLSEETRAKMSATLSGRVGWSKGKPWTEARRAAHRGLVVTDHTKKG